MFRPTYECDTLMAQRRQVLHRLAHTVLVFNTGTLHQRVGGSYINYKHLNVLARKNLNQSILGPNVRIATRSTRRSII